MWLAGLFSMLGSGIKSFFGFKKDQANVINSAVNVAGKLVDSSATEKQALAKIIATEAGSGYWLAAVWRPLLMMFFAVLIGARWFGYTPPNMSEAEILEMYGLLQMGIGGYIGSRGLEKIVSSLGLSKVLSEFVRKKLG